MSVDLKLDSNQDLVIENGDLVSVQDSNEVVQAIKTRLLHILGEWIFDYTEGVDWFGEMFDPSTPEEQKKAIIRNVIINTKHVRRVLGLEYFKDSVERAARIEFKIDTDFGVISTELTI